MTVVLAIVAVVVVVWFVLAGAGRLDRYEDEIERDFRWKL